jgi:hypothetical protein
VLLQALLRDDQVQQLMQVNRHQDILWFNKEAFEQLAWWLLVVATIHATAHLPAAQQGQQILASFEVLQQLLRAEEQSGYQVEELLRLVGESTPTLGA